MFTEPSDVLLYPQNKAYLEKKSPPVHETEILHNMRQQLPRPLMYYLAPLPLSFVTLVLGVGSIYGIGVEVSRIINAESLNVGYLLLRVVFIATGLLGLSIAFMIGRVAIVYYSYVRRGYLTELYREMIDMRFMTQGTVTAIQSGKITTVFYSYTPVFPDVTNANKPSAFQTRSTQSLQPSDTVMVLYSHHVDCLL